MTQTKTQQSNRRPSRTRISETRIGAATILIAGVIGIGFLLICGLSSCGKTSPCTPDSQIAVDRCVGDVLFECYTHRQGNKDSCDDSATAIAVSKCSRFCAAKSAPDASAAGSADQ